MHALVYAYSLYKAALLKSTWLRHTSSHHLKELNTAIQCLGIKPKAINDSCIKDTERNGI